MKEIDVYLVSDSTGETVSGVAKAALAHFQNIQIHEHLYPLFRHEAQLEELNLALEKKPGIIMYTLIDNQMRNKLHDICDKHKLPCFGILSKLITDLSNYLRLEASNQPGRQHILNDQYYLRVDAVNYSIAHDDGQLGWNLEESDIILVGASRTSKSPTCMYLAYRGFKAANIPFVYGTELPQTLFKVKKPLIVGLTINLDRLIQIRKNRLLSLDEHKNTNYVSEENVEDELNEAKKTFLKNNWPIIDVSKRSVEEVSALIIQLYDKKNNNG